MLKKTYVGLYSLVAMAMAFASQSRADSVRLTNHISHGQKVVSSQYEIDVALRRVWITEEFECHSRTNRGGNCHATTEITHLPQLTLDVEAGRILFTGNVGTVTCATYVSDTNWLGNPVLRITPTPNCAFSSVRGEITFDDGLHGRTVNVYQTFLNVAR